MKKQLITGSVTALVLGGSIFASNQPSRHQSSTPVGRTQTQTTVNAVADPTDSLTPLSVNPSPPAATTDNTNNPSAPADSAAPNQVPPVDPPAPSTLINSQITYKQSPTKPDSEDIFCTYTYSDNSVVNNFAGTEVIGGKVKVLPDC